MTSRIRSNAWSRHLIILFIVFSVGIGISGYLFQKDQRERLKHEEWEHLAAIADFKVKQIAIWRKERITDAEAVFENKLAQRYFQEILESPKTTASQNEVRDWIRSLEGYFQYHRAFLVSRTGSVVLTVPEGEKAPNRNTMALISEAMTKNQVLLSDLYLDEERKSICINILIPIHAGSGVDSLAEGVLVICIDPNRELYPLIQAWPTPSQSAESLLVRAEGESGVFLNELRHRKNSALTFRFSLSDTELPAAKALSGQEGTMEGVDYRGIPVFAVLRRIPDSPWFLVSKVDREETYSHLRKQSMLIGMVAGLLIIGAGLTAILLWRGQRLREGERVEGILKEANKELERRVAERSAELQSRNEALRESEFRLRNLSSQILKAQEDERQRIAADIHDSLIAQMSVIKLNMETVLDRTKADSVACESLRSLIDLTKRGIDETRRIMTDLRPSLIDDLGLLPALTWYCREFENRYPQFRIEQRFALTEEGIPGSLRIPVFRISQEALNNAAKHSRGNSIQFHLSCSNNRLDLKITDDGEGMDPIETQGPIDPRKNLGLAGMQERARLSGGQFAIESRRGQGTRVSAWWEIGQVLDP